MSKKPNRKCTISYDAKCKYCKGNNDFHILVYLDEVPYVLKLLEKTIDSTDKNPCLVCKMCFKFRDDLAYAKILPRFLKRIIKEEYGLTFNAGEKTWH